jgi:hypothetical protein
VRRILRDLRLTLEDVYYHLLAALSLQREFACHLRAVFLHHFLLILMI